MVPDLHSFPPTKENAVFLGFSRFYTGKPCANGHTSLRRASDGKCMGCVSAKRAKYRNSHKGKESAKLYSQRQLAKERAIRASFFVPLERFDGLPRSRTEAASLNVRRYYTGKPCKHGHLTQRDVKHGCIECRNVKKDKYDKTDKGREARRRARKTPAAKAAKAAQKRRAMERIRSDPVLLEAHRKKQRDRKRKYFLTPSGRAYQRRKSLEKEAKVRQATPPWHDPGPMNEFFAGCPDDHHIDHIIPLRGRNVCGLHVTANLQYLPAQENLAKSNKIDPMTLEHAVCVLPGFRTYTHTCYDEDA